MAHSSDLGKHYSPQGLPQGTTSSPAAVRFDCLVLRLQYMGRSPGEDHCGLVSRPQMQVVIEDLNSRFLLLHFPSSAPPTGLPAMVQCPLEDCEICFAEVVGHAELGGDLWPGSPTVC